MTHYVRRKIDILNNTRIVDRQQMTFQASTSHNISRTAIPAQHCQLR